MLDNGVKEEVRGMQWHRRGDYFPFDIRVNKTPFTRRELLSVVDIG